MSTGVRNIYEQYKKFYEDGLSGHDGICHDKELKGLIKQQLIKRGADLHIFPWDDVFETILNSLCRTLNYTSTLKLLIGAFELLELAAVNLFLYPWRKEFKTINTFSGAYVHYLKPAICNEDLVRIFKKMGYKPKDNLQLEIKDTPHSLESIRLAFEFFATRIECEILLEIVGKLEHYKISVDELIRERKSMESIDTCVDKLKMSRSADRSQRESQLERTPPTVSSGENIYTDLKVNSSAWNQAGSPSQREYNGSVIRSPPQRLPRTTASDQYKDDAYSKHITGIPGTDCVFSLSHQDSKFEELQDLSKNRHDFNSDISNPNTNGNMKMVLLEGDISSIEKYEEHSCLANGESALYCCETCRTVHTIMCETLKTCDHHSLRFFAADNSTYLQKAEASNSDLRKPSYADILKTDPCCRICRCSSVYFCCKCGVHVCVQCGYKNSLECKNCGDKLDYLNPGKICH
ncbi:spermatogenesis associated 2-like [Heptranchias perlo]|uniref:spermatogenesis associated 2-like n=1 Tax=Heptranchias perlo TaxID=212740 RepID=UPI00355994CE